MWMLLLCLLAGCGERQEVGRFVWRSTAFDTEISVIAHGVSADDEARLSELLSRRVMEIERLFSLYLEGSVLSQLNRDGVLESPSEDFVRLLERALAASEKTDGLFDVTVQPLWLWYRAGRPADTSLASVLELVNAGNVLCSARRVSFKHEGMKLTLNGLVQGYLADELVKLLEREGIENALVNGGEYRALGDDAGKPWKVAISGRSGKLGELELAAGNGLAVSAGYGQVFGGATADGHHLFDPSNGSNQARNRTFVVVAETAEQADVLATALAVAVQEKWDTLCKQAVKVRVYEGRQLIYMGE